MNEKLLQILSEVPKSKKEELETLLDGLVHDTASAMASDVNNTGRKAQIEYLLKNGWSVERLSEEIQNVIKTRHDT